jgi:hypothetical protein
MPRNEDEEEDRPRRRQRDEEDEDDRPRGRRRQGEDGDEADDDRPRRRDEDDDEYDDEDRPRPRRKRRGVAGLPEGSTRDDLREVASRQKMILMCILVYLGVVVASFFLPQGLYLVIGMIALAVGITSTVFVFLLAAKLYEGGVGILLAVLTLIPCIGLLVLLIINGKATSVLKRNGVRVGLLGANRNDL